MRLVQSRGTKFCNSSIPESYCGTSSASIMSMTYHIRGRAISTELLRGPALHLSVLAEFFGRLEYLEEAVPHGL